MSIGSTSSNVGYSIVRFVFGGSNPKCSIKWEYLPATMQTMSKKGLVPGMVQCLPGYPHGPRKTRRWGWKSNAHFDAVGMWKMFHLGVGKVSNENFHMCVFQKISSEIFLMCYNQSLRIIPCCFRNMIIVSPMFHSVQLTRKKIPLLTAQYLHQGNTKVNLMSSDFLGRFPSKAYIMTSQVYVCIYFLLSHTYTYTLVYMYLCVYFPRM